MRQLRPFADERLGGACVYCCSVAGTRDHVPPRVFLDAPFPTNLAVVPCCRRCNGVTSADEEYLACLLEVAACGVADISRLERPSIVRTLTGRPALLARLMAAVNPSEPSVDVEHERVRRVVEKIGRGLWAFEAAASSDEITTSSTCTPLLECDASMIEAFEALAPLDLLPEVGSRLMFRVIEEWGLKNRWQVVQPRRFAYAIEAGSSQPRVKMVIRDYLACVVYVSA